MSISLHVGNSCPTSGFTHISSWEACRAALSVYSVGKELNEIIDGSDYNGLEPSGPDENWPKGCYYCDNVDSCDDGVWFNDASVGSSNGGAQVFCGNASFELMIASSQTTLLFVGDSDVDFWEEVESTFGTQFPNDSSHGTAAYNVGYGGYTCKDVKNESSDFISVFEPSKVVLVCGENDLSDGSTPAVTFASYQTAVMPYVHSGATVYSFSTKPEPATTGLHNKYKQLDSLIKDWAATLDGKLVFIDTSGGFEDLGNGVDLYHGDKLHLSEVGYQYWEQWLTIALEDSSNCQVWRSGVCVQASNEDDIACIDSPLDFIVSKRPRDCDWASRGNSVKRCGKKGVSAHCPSTCGTCAGEKCSDSGRKFVLKETGAKKRCGFFAWNTDRCDKFDYAVETCRDSCGYCDYDEEE